MDLTDDEVAERFWERVAEQIEIQEDGEEWLRYRPYRGMRDADPDHLGRGCTETSTANSSHPPTRNTDSYR